MINAFLDDLNIVEEFDKEIDEIVKYKNFSKIINKFKEELEEFKIEVKENNELKILEEFVDLTVVYIQSLKFKENKFNFLNEEYYSAIEQFICFMTNNPNLFKKQNIMFFAKLKIERTLNYLKYGVYDSKSIKPLIHDLISIKDIRVHNLYKSLKESGLPKSNSPEISFKRGERLGKMGNGHSNFLTGITVAFELEADQVFWQEWERYHFQQTVSSTSKMHNVQNMQLSLVCNAYVSAKIRKMLREYIDLYKSFNDKSFDFVKCDKRFNDLNVKYDLPISYHLGKKLRIDKQLLIHFSKKIILKKEIFNTIIYNCPLGLKLKKGLRLNYQQLKTMYNQRKNHKTLTWRMFCEHIKTFPKFKELTGVE